MYALPKSNYLKRSLLVNARGQVYDVNPTLLTHSQRIKNDLHRLGVSPYAMWRSESRFLPHIIRPDEQLGGIVYGHCKEGFAMLIATDRRVVFLDKKPLFINQDEFNYFAITGVTFSQAGPGCKVTLHTRIKDYELQTFNEVCARNFVQYIESQCLDYQGETIPTRQTAVRT